MPSPDTLIDPTERETFFARTILRPIVGVLARSRGIVLALPHVRFWHHAFMSMDRNAIVVCHPNSPKDDGEKIEQLHNLDLDVDPDSVLFVTLDSCRFDTFRDASAPNMKAVAPFYKAQAPGHFTYGSHASMFVGFTPSVPGKRQAYIDSKFGKLFLVGNVGYRGDTAAFSLTGRSIAEGFNRRDYRTIGTGATHWFDPATEIGQLLMADFHRFYYAENVFSLHSQLRFLAAEIRVTKEPIFAFLNVGETHVPYYFEGAPWSPDDYPCIPYQTEDRSEECRMRQTACLEFVDTEIAPLLQMFQHATILLCADHGDCWGEDGLWEHGVSHEATLTVPLIIRLRGEPVVLSD